MVKMLNKLIKLIIFDLDGVLIEAKEIHYRSLNKALEEPYEISWEDHLSIYDGLKTKKKLEILTKRKGLPFEKHDSIWEAKQLYMINKYSVMLIKFHF